MVSAYAGIVALRQALALAAAQHGVDQPGARAAVEQARGLDGGRHRGMRRQRQHVQLRQADQQQRVRQRIAALQRLRQKMLEREFQCAPMADRAVADGFQQGAVAGVGEGGTFLGHGRLQRTALQHLQHRAGGGDADLGAGGIQTGNGRALR